MIPHGVPDSHSIRPINGSATCSPFDPFDLAQGKQAQGREWFDSAHHPELVEGQAKRVESAQSQITNLW
jgi:hypothetical protein